MDKNNMINMTPAQKALLQELGNPIEPIAVLLCDNSYADLLKTLKRKPTLSEVYNAFSGHWFAGVGEQRIQQAEYAICIVEQHVYGVWDIERWVPSNSYPGKWMFEGSPSLKHWELKSKVVTMLNRQFEANSNRLLNIPEVCSRVGSLT
jgi:hypothetical protein